MTQTITYSQLVSIIVKQFNKFRYDPLYILPVLQKRMESYNGTTYQYNKNVSIQTQQGVVPVRQVITILNSMNRIPKLNWSFELHCAANKRAKMLARTQDTNTQNINNVKSLQELLADEIEFTDEVSEHFLYGYCEPIDIVTQLLIDDGNPQRQNRMQLLNPLVNFVGIGIEQHPKYKIVVVIIFAARVQPKKIPNLSQITENIIQTYANKGNPADPNIPQHYNTGILSLETFEQRKEPQCKGCSIF